MKHLQTFSNQISVLHSFYTLLATVLCPLAHLPVELKHLSHLLSNLR